MLFVNGEGIRERGQYGQRHVDDSFLLCFNAHDAPLRFAMPSHDYGQKWERVISTVEAGPDDQRVVEAGASIVVPDRSLVVLDRTV
jgi:glycogen operon protein